MASLESVEANTGRPVSAGDKELLETAMRQEEYKEVKGIRMGSPDAPVTIVEYSNHFCGHCAAFHETILPLIVSSYVRDGKVNFIQVMLSNLDIGAALICAERQDKAPALNEYIFENISELSSMDELRERIVEDLGINKEEFDECYNIEGDSELVKEVQAWFAQAEEAGVTGTPTFFVNGEKLVGNRSIETFKEVIDRKLGEIES